MCCQHCGLLLCLCSGRPATHVPNDVQPGCGPCPATVKAAQQGACLSGRHHTLCAGPCPVAVVSHTPDPLLACRCCLTPACNRLQGMQPCAATVTCILSSAPAFMSTHCVFCEPSDRCCMTLLSGLQANDGNAIAKRMPVCLLQANWIERGLKSMLGLFTSQKGPRPSGDWFRL